jgi:hypothetical protein
MKPEISDWGTLFLAMWVQNGTCSLTGTLRDGDGALQPNIIDRCGAPWPALAEALADARLIDLPLMILCNDAAIVQALQGKIPPAPTNTERIFVLHDKEQQIKTKRKGEYIEVGTGGDADHWLCLMTLSQWPAAWRAIVATHMPTMEEQWKRQFQPA